jgi:type I restriction enzyme S subunit
MITDLRPYGEYKASGLPWLGQVPAHWEVRRIKTVLRETDRRTTDGQGTLLSLTRVRGLITHREMTDRIHSAKTLVGYKCYRPGQLVMNRMQAWSGMFGAGSIDGLVSPDYAVFDVLGSHSVSFLLERLKNPDLVAQFALESKGIGSGFNRLYTDRFGPIPVPLPPPDEQAAIVRFLDWANGRLERAIRAKRKVIALLNEQKQAIIHRAVTRGLDPSVPLKDSGVPWLGEIPAHWEVRRIKYLLREIDERSSTGNEPLLSMRMHHGLVLFAEHFSRAPQAATLVGFKVVRPGHFVVNRMQAGNGVIFASELTGLVSPDYAVFQPIGDANVVFLGELFRSRAVRAKFRSESKGLGTGSSGFLRLYNDRLGAIHVALPPRTGQEAILNGLDDKLIGIDTTIARLEREITLLREYRTRLVADVVTGKLDVRDAAAALPDEAPLDDDAAPSDADDDAIDSDDLTDVEGDA